MLLLGSNAWCFEDALPQDAFPVGSSHSHAAHVPWPWLPALHSPLFPMSTRDAGAGKWLQCGPDVMPWRCCESVSALSQGRVVPLVPGLGGTWGWAVLPAEWGGPRAVPPSFCAVPAALLRAPGWHSQHERALVLLQP